MVLGKVLVVRVWGFWALGFSSCEAFEMGFIEGGLAFSLGCKVHIPNPYPVSLNGVWDLGGFGFSA